MTTNEKPGRFTWKKSDIIILDPDDDEEDVDDLIDPVLEAEYQATKKANAKKKEEVEKK